MGGTGPVLDQLWAYGGPLTPRITLNFVHQKWQLLAMTLGTYK